MNKARLLRAVPGLACALFLVLSTACGVGAATPAATVAQPQARRTVPVRVSAAWVGAIGVSTTYPATVEAQNGVNVGPVTSGLVQRINVETGSEVKKGDILAELSHGTLDVQLDQAQGVLKNAEAQLATLSGTAVSAQGYMTPPWRRQRRSLSSSSAPQRRTFKWQRAPRRSLRSPTTRRRLSSTSC